MKHFANVDFWVCYKKLPAPVQKIADKNFLLLKENPNHPSLHFKKIGRFRAVRVGIKYRALAVEINEGLIWFWIGTHAEYDKLISS